MVVMLKAQSFHFYLAVTNFR